MKITNIILKLAVVLSLLVSKAGLNLPYLPPPSSTLRPMAAKHKNDTILNRRKNLNMLISQCSIFVHEHDGIWMETFGELENLQEKSLRTLQFLQDYKSRFNIPQDLINKVGRTYSTISFLMVRLPSLTGNNALKGTIPDKRYDPDNQKYKIALAKVLKGIEDHLGGLDKLDFSKIEFPVFESLKFKDEKKSLESVKAGINFMKSLCRRFLKTNGEYDFVGNQQEIELKSSIKNARLYFRKSKRYKLQFSIPEDLPKIRIDPDLLEEIWFNMIRNARQAGAKNINISAKHIDGNVNIYIKDDGNGIKKENLGKIFQAYWTSDKDDGTGLGLYICKEIVTAAGGKISVESTLGKGTTFTISLPAIPTKSSSSGENDVPDLQKIIEREASEVLKELMPLTDAAIDLIDGFPEVPEGKELPKEEKLPKETVDELKQLRHIANGIENIFFRARDELVEKRAATDVKNMRIILLGVEKTFTHVTLPDIAWMKQHIFNIRMGNIILYKKEKEQMKNYITLLRMRIYNLANISSVSDTSSIYLKIKPSPEAPEEVLILIPGMPDNHPYVMDSLYSPLRIRETATDISTRAMFYSAIKKALILKAINAAA
ncbi:MAG: HAMP domain-containing sensor histidine kinase [Candidatus Omnitrophota bacterium]